MLKFNLSSGGIIVNYRCPAACGHCLYGCSPTAEPGYITEEAAEAVCKTLRRLGCSSVHIGGGEPFLDTDGLVVLVETVIRSGMSIDYIETNAAWITGDEKHDVDTLARVARAGGDCIMVSADPFHIEFVPLWKTLELIRILQKIGLQHFIWQQRYLSLLSKLDVKKRYTAEELHGELGYDLVSDCVREYGMGFNGRALNYLRKFGIKKAADEFLQAPPCRELQNTGHFHVDFLKRFIVSNCMGMGISIEDLQKDLDPAQYPVMSRLLSGGLNALWEHAVEHGFQPEPSGYVSKCDLCFNIRKHLISSQPGTYTDLTPTSYYRQNF